MMIADLFARLRLKPDSKSFDAATRTLNGLKTALTGIVAFAAGRGMLSLIEQTTNAASNAVEAAAKLGITAEAVQELGFAAQQSGLEQEELNAALFRFSKKVSGPLDRELGKVADRFARMPDGARKARLAQELFGRSGTKLIPLLNEGAAGVDKLRQEARDLGIVIDNESAASLESFGDETDKAKGAVAGLRNQAIIAILPALRELTQRALAWIKANRQIVTARLLSLMRGFVVALRLAGKAIAFVIDASELLVRHWKVVALVAASLGAAMLILKAKTVAAAIASAASWALAALPIIAIGAAILAVILIVEDLYRAFTGGQSVFKDMYLAAKEWIGDRLAKVIGAAKFAVDKFLGRETDDERAARLADEQAQRTVRARRVEEARNPALAEQTNSNIDIAQRNLGTREEIAAARRRVERARALAGLSIPTARSELRPDDERVVSTFDALQRGRITLSDRFRALATPSNTTIQKVDINVQGVPNDPEATARAVRQALDTTARSLGGGR